MCIRDREDMDTRTDEKLYDIRQKVGMVFQNPDNQIVATVVEEDLSLIHISGAGQMRPRHPAYCKPPAQAHRGDRWGYSKCPRCA